MHKKNKKRINKKSLKLVLFFKIKNIQQFFLIINSTVNTIYKNIFLCKLVGVSRRIKLATLATDLSQKNL